MIDRASRRIGIFGGTFDPVHFGHLRPALELHELLELDELRLLPCHLPSHRDTPGASTAQRISMLELAVTDISGVLVDNREALRDTWSWSVDTLLSFRAEMPQAGLMFIMGLDAFGKFTSWHRWQHILELAHLVVIDRPGASLGSEEEHLMMSRRCRNVDELPDPAGGILRVDIPQSDISATRIRELVGAGRDIRFLVPESVRHYIVEQRLYR